MEIVDLKTVSFYVIYKAIVFEVIKIKWIAICFKQDKLLQIN